MPQRALRFAVRDGAKRAASWKLWTESGRGASDVYLVCRQLGGTIKTSLHESGRWHVAFEQGAFEEKIEGVISSLSTRFVEKWPKPAELSPGITLAYRIVVPAVAVTSPITSHDDEVSWLPNAPDGMATEIDIILIAGVLAEGGWPGRRSMNTSFLGSLPLDNGSTVCAVHHVVEMPKLQVRPGGTGQFVRGVTRRSLEGANLRAIVFGIEQDGSRTIFDLAGQVGPADGPIN